MSDHTIVVIWVIKVSSVYFCHLFLISSASVRSLLFLSFIIPIHAWCVPLISPSYLKRSLILPILLFSSISLHCSFKKVFLSLLAVLWNSEFNWVYFPLSPLLFISLLFSSICKAPSDNLFAFLDFFFFGMLCYKSVHSSSGTLPDIIPWIYSSLTLY